MDGEISDTQNIASGSYEHGCTDEGQFLSWSVFLQSHACIYHLEGKNKHKFYEVFLEASLSWESSFLT